MLIYEHPLVAILVTLATIAIPILWDMHKDTTSLELRIIGAVQLVNKEAFESGFAVMHSGTELDSLARVTLTLTNTGTKAIKASQILQQPKVSFPASSRVLTLQVEPLDKVKLQGAADIQGSNVTIPIQLLNPSEAIRFSVYAQSEFRDLLRPTPSCRIEYLDSIKVVDLVDEVEAAGVKAATERVKRLSKHFWIALGLVVPFLAVMLFVSLKEAMQQRALQNQLKLDASLLTQFVDAASLSWFVNKKMQFISVSDRKQINSRIIESESTDAKHELADLYPEIRKLILEDSTAMASVTFSCLFLTIAIVYMCYALFVYVT